VAIVVGSSCSGLVLDHAHGFLGLSGWRWMFFAEGVPAVLLGFVTLFYLVDVPAKAKWLSNLEKAALQRRLEREQPPQPKQGKVWREIFSRNVLILALMHSGMVTGLAAGATWTPQIVREILKAHSLSSVGFFTAIPPVCAVICMHLWGVHSDKKMERSGHYMLPIVVAALSWIPVAFLKTPEIRMFALVFVSVGTFCGQVIFWTIVPHVLSPNARAIGLAFIQTVGMAVVSIDHLSIGFLKDVTHGWAASLMFIAVMLLASAFLVHLIPANEKVPAMAAGVKANG
jgi:ACS family 4-hydroxyphenylacetate permease-like MFS transporter